MQNTMEPDDIKLSLQDAGCAEIQAAYVAQLLKDGQKEAALREMNQCRCRLLESLHKTQRQMDCLDDLIRKSR